MHGLPQLSSPQCSAVQTLMLLLLVALVAPALSRCRLLAQTAAENGTGLTPIEYRIDDAATLVQELQKPGQENLRREFLLAPGGNISLAGLQPQLTNASLSSGVIVVKGGTDAQGRTTLFDVDGRSEATVSVPVCPYAWS